MVFFFDADLKVYARYGGRDGVSADNRQSLDGLLYTMKSVLRTHQQEAKEYAPKSGEGPKTIRDLAGGRGGGGCMHCHQIRESLDGNLRRNGQWTRDSVWRYPLPDNVGLELEVDRGNIVKKVKEGSPAAAAGIQPGDVVRRLNGVPIHSFGDAQFALDRAPRTGAVDIALQRGEQLSQEKLTLAEGWRKIDISWRASMRRVIGSARMYGNDLTTEEKMALGLSPKQLAFRQRYPVSSQAEGAGLKVGDIVLGLDDKPFEMDVSEFQHHVRAHYLVGDKATVQIVRDGKRMSLNMTFNR